MADDVTSTAEPYTDLDLAAQLVRSALDRLPRRAKGIARLFADQGIQGEPCRSVTCPVTVWLTRYLADRGFGPDRFTVQTQDDRISIRPHPWTPTNSWRTDIRYVPATWPLCQLIGAVDTCKPYTAPIRLPIPYKRLVGSPRPGQ